MHAESVLRRKDNAERTVPRQYRQRRCSTVPFVTGFAYPVLAFLDTSTLAASVGSALPKSSFAKPSHDDEDEMVFSFNIHIKRPVVVNISVSDMDSGTECTFNQFANDTKLCGVVNTLRGRGVIHKVPDSLERWVCVNLMQFNKAKFKAILGQGNPKYR
ncbi:hypothetical protein WISP_47600 [Willisornis vidua]|uniref:Uncharacterized protein n=1 Tax=Willisornis vidua TaxID=1566151 RepID=A0ABQ9DJA6_9PASS|nr:hypothetical protein WISP_47600 [Willisornis vidua]